MKSQRTLVKLLVASAFASSLAFAAPVQAAPTITFATLMNGTGGAWFGYPTAHGCGIFHLYAIAGTDLQGPILNPDGGMNIALPDGTYTMTFIGDGGSGSNTTERNLNLYLDGSTVPNLALSSFSSAPVTYKAGTTRITASTFTYTDPDYGAPWYDRIATCGVYPDGYSETIARVTFTVSQVSPAEQVDEIAVTVAGLGLDAGEANALDAKLDGAVEALARGNKGAARGKLGAFQNHVDALVKSGRLAAAQGQSLNAAVDAVLARI
jgi:hypothetical protein